MVAHNLRTASEQFHRQVVGTPSSQKMERAPRTITRTPLKAWSYNGMNKTTTDGFQNKLKVIHQRTAELKAVSQLAAELFLSRRRRLTQ